MKTRTAQSNLNQPLIIYKCRVTELANGSLKMANPYSKHYHSVKAQHFAEVK